MSEYRKMLEQAADTHGLLPELLELYDANDRLRAELEAAKQDAAKCAAAHINAVSACNENAHLLTKASAELAELRARVPAICFPRQPKCDIAEVIVDQVESWLSDSAPSDDFIIDVTEEQKDALNSIVWEWFYKNVSPKHWTVTDVHQHEAAILAAKEKGQ